MIKKISSTNLRTGMFIHDLNCKWIENPFLMNQFIVKSDNMIKKIIAQGIKQVYIDVEKGVDEIIAVTVKEPSLAESGTESGSSYNYSFISRTSLEDEVESSLKIRDEAKKMLTSVFEDVKAGKDLNVQHSKGVVENMVKSAHRNDDALPYVLKLEMLEDYMLSHSINVAALMISFCRALAMKPETIVQVGIGAMFHDIGKLKVKAGILDKKIALEPEEREEARRHVIYGQEILERASGVSNTARLIIEQHHERYDGSGYPGRLKGENISKLGQIASIIDVYDALSTDKAYQKGVDLPAALRKLFQIAAKSEMNDYLVQTFIRYVGIYPIGAIVKLQSGKVGIVIKQNKNNALFPTVKVFYDAKKERYISPKEERIWQQQNQENPEKIIGHELPNSWNINPLEMLR